MAPAIPVTQADRPLLPLWLALVVAAASGPVMAYGFPGVGAWPLTFVAIAMVLVSLIGRRPHSALLVGFVAGLAFYLVLIQWASLFLGLLPMSALSVLESLFVALGSMVIALVYRFAARLWPSRTARLLLLPVVVAGVWTCREAIDSTWPYGGFAWGRVALSQSEGPVTGLFSWIGVSGVSFVMVFLVALVIEAVRMTSASGLARGTISVGAFALVFAIPAFPVVVSGSTTVAAVQGDGPAGYFDPTRTTTAVLADQYTATLPLFGRKVDMVVWPEGSTDLDPLESATAARAFDRVSEQMHAPLIAGTVTHRGSKYFNTSLLWVAGKGAIDHYDKKHPVPFGEYVPNRAFWRLFAPSLIDLVTRDYTPGTTDTVFNVNGTIAGIDICFDISDDTVMRDSIDSGAQLLIAQTNNADFGHTDESVQQLAIARIRALELGRSVVNISTVGTSAIISPTGSTIDHVATFTPATMVDKVPLSATRTPASYLGQGIEWFVSILGVGTIILAMIMSRSDSSKSDSSKQKRARGGASRG